MNRFQNFRFLNIISHLIIVLALTPGLLIAGVATGGPFTMESSLYTANQHSSAAGDEYSLIGSIGEGIYPTVEPHQPLKSTLYRIYPGFLGIPLKMDPGATSLLSVPDGGVTITIPGGALPQPYEAMIETDPTSNSITGNSVALFQATQKLEAEFGPAVRNPSAIIEIQILLDDNTLFTDSMNNPANLSLDYQDRGDGGRVLAYRLDETNQEWVVVDSDLTNGQFASFSSQQTKETRIPQDKAGIFALFQQGSNDVNPAYAYPVPWRPNANDAALYGTYSGGITFTKLPSVGIIEIFNIAGELVREILIPPGQGQFQWDAKTGSGHDVSSGVYIWNVESEGYRKIGKLMIIR